MRIVILGLSITSSWGNGHATTYRGLVREMVRRGHDVLFLERDVPWYAAHRDLPNPPYGRTELYTGMKDLRTRFARSIADADAVMVGRPLIEALAVGGPLGVAHALRTLIDEWAITLALAGPPRRSDARDQ